MELVRTIVDLHGVLRGWGGRESSRGLVPTMGYLHRGHLSLVERARRENERVVVTVFVNPAQFGPNEDLERYPRDARGDAEKLRGAGVDLLFMPDVAEMYPPGFQTAVEVGNVSNVLCGRIRPGHFRGVATVVAKLLNLIKPHRAYFGAKDYQQTVVIDRMTRDLNIDSEIVVCPTVREPDGLAMSSRNAYLSGSERAAATVLFRALTAAADRVTSSDPPDSADALRLVLADAIASEPGARLEYAEIRDAETLEESPSLRGSILMALAVRIGNTRLIDNMVIDGPGRGSEA